ncbi:sensor histidine kinase NtrY-like [Pelagibius marinus]|uniref:sensor histidine kinase NtrY-like n=1 Tax=Pelagibius marinus TaxID=2762760 RepID=UPI0029CA0604|nr:PAS domain-containing sensor histidine kinase [Pelagibius marinus]
MANIQQTGEITVREGGETRPGEAPADERVARPRFGRLLDWLRRIRAERTVALILLVGALVSGTATFVAMTGNLSTTADTGHILLLLLADLVIILGLAALITRRLAILWIERKKGRAGSRLHGRLVALFSVVAVAPTILVAAFSVIIFDLGLEFWFSERVSTAIKNSRAVAAAYLDEHQQAIAADALAIAQVLNRGGPSLVYNPTVFNNVMTRQANQRYLTEAAVYDSSGRMLARSSSFLLAFNPEIPEWAFERARSEGMAIMTSEEEDRVRALVRLDLSADAYLYVGRLVDSRVIGHMESTRWAVQRYEDLEGNRFSLQITFALIFLVVALLLLLVAVWIGLAFANQLTGPIGSLIATAEKVGKGDLKARVQGPPRRDEIGNLSRAFNKMTGQLERQQDALLEANEELDNRNRFIEAVLGGVSAGVIGLDEHGRINLANRMACDFLGKKFQTMRGQTLTEVMPEIDDLQARARRRPRKLAEQQLTIPDSSGSERVLLVRISAELEHGAIMGFVVTFDEITQLLAAQRKAAWSDIARRIAHEIKNPLTPIQLAAERLKRKYVGQITNDPDTFQICTDTIVRHVGDIGRMVDEFSAFARMPAPDMRKEDIGKLVQEAVFLQRTARQDVRFDYTPPSEEILLACDGRQVGQALTNLLKNAIESIEGRHGLEGEAAPAGVISVTIRTEDAHCVVDICDNGKGLPRADRYRLTEPYVTTRERGTGLGLAIVKKIMEDHGGNLILRDREEGGAIVSLIFPLREEVVDSGAGRPENEAEAPDVKRAAGHG